MDAFIYATTETRLDIKTNTALCDYLDAYLPVYNQVSRFLWYALQDPDFSSRYKSRSQFISFVCVKFNLLKRTVNSLYYDISGRISALRALKKHELKQLKHKVKALEKKQKTLVKKINTIKKRVAINKIVEAELVMYRKLKQSLFYLQRKLNKKRQQLVACTHALGQRMKLCFGTKRLFNAQYHLPENGFKSHVSWYNAFVKNRDRNIFYMGSKDETCGNQLLQLAYDDRTGAFRIKLRREKNFENPDHHVAGQCDFRYLKNELLALLKNNDQALTFRFKKKMNRWYLQVVVAMEPARMVTTTGHGAIGLDYNEGFIALSETDAHGNLTALQQLDITGDSASTRSNSLCVVVKTICQKAVATGKTIVIEDLNFNMTKGKTISAISKNGKRYNRMIHQFDYSRYKERMLATGFKLGADVVLVNPCNTSKIARQKYCEPKKLTIHQGASYVIARRGQGFRDTLIV